MPDAVHFRRATRDDWPGIWRVFSRVIESGDTYTFPPEMTEHAARSEWLHVADGRMVTFVATIDDRVVGTALLKPNLGGLGDHVANAGWMIDPDQGGRGIGRRFAEFVIAEARSVGFSGMQFNAVVGTNERALRLWRSLGFAEIGRVPNAFRHRAEGLTELVILHRDLA